MQKLFFLKKLTIKKAFNFLKLLISFNISNILKRPFYWGMPSGISIEPTNLCNLFCKECPTGNQTLNRKKGNIDLEIYKKAINELSSYLTNVILYFQGEPYLNKLLFKMISYANSKNIYTSTSTNGHFLDEENSIKTIKSGLDELIISIDGITQEVYENYRVGGSLEKVISGINNIVKAKKKLKSKKPFVIIQFLVLKTNEHQIKEIKKLSKALGVNKLQLKSAQIYDYKNNSLLIPDIQKYSRYKKQKDGSFEIRSKLKNKCWRMWTNPVITIEGDVIPCCFDKDAKYKMGNIKEESFEKIWRNKNYCNFRKRILKSRKNIDMCRNCTEGLRIQ
ncbi:MAG: SPASM domain-containing protein [Bacteroidales bacterium]|nr:SPASM domain-containing protein [Bacteroidales bacterium]MBN2758215.1 SPASM domain-containing protein [Bacteroidales bacterium]